MTLMVLLCLKNWKFSEFGLDIKLPQGKSTENLKKSDKHKGARILDKRWGRSRRLLIFENRRNHLQLLTEILELCKMPQAKTSILRKINTNFKLLESYLLQLQTSYLLEIQPETRRYFTTGEGQEFIETWIKLKTILYPPRIPISNQQQKMQ